MRWRLLLLMAVMGVMLVGVPCAAMGAEPTVSHTGWLVASGADPSGGIVGVSCGSATTCVAIDANGHYLKYRATDGWSDPESTGDDQTLSSLSCPSVTVCVAGDEGGDIITYDGTNWSAPSQVDASGWIMSISCPSTSFCVAVDAGGKAVTYDGNSWSAPATIDSETETIGSYTFTVGIPLESVSCASASLCVVGDVYGREVTYTDSTWSSPQSLFSGGNYAMTMVACPSASLCLAVDEGGDWAESTNPAGGSPMWSSPSAIGPTVAAVSGLSCASYTFCQVTLPNTTEVFDGTKWTALGPVDDWLGRLACVLDSSTDPARPFCASYDSSGDTMTWTPQKPYTESTPSFHGEEALVGQPLTVTQAEWDSAWSSVLDQWYDCPAGETGTIAATCTAITGAIGTTYTPQASDEGYYLEVVETASNPYGAQTVDSYPVADKSPSIGQVGPVLPRNIGAPAITGSPQVGQKLTVNGDVWDGQVSSRLYYWLDCDSAGENCRGIARSDAFRQTYTVASSDVGYTLEVAVSACNDSPPCSDSVFSQPTAVVTNPPGGGGGGSGNSGGGSGGSGGATTPPPAPTGAVSAKSAVSTSPSGTATATNAGSTVAARGEGSFTLAQYGGNPVSTPSATSPAPFGAGAGGAASFLDVHVAPGSSFSTLQLKDCNLDGGYTLFWWNGTAWLPATPQTYSPGPPACATATLTNASSPTVHQLTGTVFAVVYTARASAKKPHVNRTKASVPVNCAGSSKAKCVLTIVLTATAKVKNGKVIAVTADAARVKGKSNTKTTSKMVVLGLVKVTLTGGQSRTVTVSLNGTGSRLLRQRHRLSAELTVQEAGNTVARATIGFSVNAARNHP